MNFLHVIVIQMEDSLAFLVLVSFMGSTLTEPFPFVPLLKQYFAADAFLLYFGFALTGILICLTTCFSSVLLSSNNIINNGNEPLYTTETRID